MLKMTARPSFLHRAIFVAILALAAFLRFYCLTCSSLWHDEGNSWAVAQRSFVQIARDAAADIHPPGYYWLLKLWAGPFEFSAWGMRSLSAFAGLLTVAVVYLIAREISGGPERDRTGFALLASLLAALNPFQVFYSQEARMYALLTLESTALMWSLLAISRRWAAHGPRARIASYAAVYLLSAALGLWTHYIFVVILAAAGGAVVWWWLEWRRAPRQDGSDLRLGLAGLPRAANQWMPLLLFLGLNALALLSYLPWLPTGIERLLNWPSQNGFVGPADGLRLTLHTLAMGSIRSGPQLAWGWLLLVVLLPLLGLWQTRRSDAGAVLLLWLLLPTGVMFTFGLFNPSFLKFLLILSPAWCLAAAASPLYLSARYFSLHSIFWRRRGVYEKRTGALPVFQLRIISVAIGAVAALAAALAVAALPPYYSDPAARDNYAGMARTVDAVGNPERDLVILNAPGQADVWRFYDVEMATLPLPSERPPDRAKTEDTLARETANRRRVFAILWATEQSDQGGIVESWLGRNAFKGLESWQGNVRFATYFMPQELSCTALEQQPRFGDVADLIELCLSQEQLAAGDTLMIGLRWRPLTTPDRRFKVTVQLLDGRDQVVVQRDGEPAGGTLPTLDWQEGIVVTDNHGLPLPPGTPPGDYRLIVALYDAETGARLSTQSGDAIEIAQPTLNRPENALPVTIIPMQHRTNLEFGRVTVVGYDYYRKAFAHAPQTALAEGDMLQVTLYWQAPTPLPSNWPTDQSMRLLLGDQAVNSPLAGGSYPTRQWHAGELVRSTFEIYYDGSDPNLWLEVENERIRLGRVSHNR